MTSADLTWMPAWQMRELIASGEVSPVEVVEHVLARIEEHNDELRALRHVDAEGARRQAADAEANVRRGDPLGPLHGIPIAVKEHISIAGLPQKNLFEAGDTSARHDDLLVARLHDAGAIMIGTTTMMGTSIFEYNWDAEARNPWDSTRVPGWSSSGSAAAVAAGLLPIALGSDGGGSTRLPGSYCGVVGLHPTAGMVPMYNPSAPMRSNPTATIGPLTRDVRDAAITLQAMAGPDGRDFDCIQTPAPDLLSRLDEGVDSMTFAWTDDYGFTSMYAFEESPRIIEAVRGAAVGLADHGATVKPTDAVWEDFMMGYMNTLFLFGGASPAGQMPTPDEDLWVANIECRRRNWDTFHAVFAEADLVLSVTSQLLAPKVEDWASYWAGSGPVDFPHGMFAPHYTSHTHLLNWLGFPAISVPAGLVDGLPVGLQIVGCPGRETQVLRAAHAFLAANPPARPAVS